MPNGSLFLGTGPSSQLRGVRTAARGSLTRSLQVLTHDGRGEHRCTLNWSCAAPGGPWGTTSSTCDHPLCVGLFYAFLSISSRHYHPDIGAEFDPHLPQRRDEGGRVRVTLLLWFLIRYVNRYMLRQKQPTLAIQGCWGWRAAPWPGSSSPRPSASACWPLGLGDPHWGGPLPVHHRPAAGQLRPALQLTSLPLSGHGGGLTLAFSR